MRAGDALRHAAGRLSLAGIEGARREARLLLAESAKLTMASLLTDPGQEVDAVAFDALVARRARREPMALILGWQEFWSLRFEVSRDTLIPRADSETLIEAALNATTGVARVLDLGTGTGCLLLAALSELPDAWGVGVDANPCAAALARRNAHTLGLARRAAFVCGDWGAALAPAFDLVLCNPPYIQTRDLADLMPEVAGHEPAKALDGGDDGLDAYRRILPVMGVLLSPSGVAVLELGRGQDGQVADIAHASALAVRTVRADLAGIPRALVLTRG